jgi:hypothetical protein
VVTKLFLDVVTTFLAWVVGLFPTWDRPSWLSSAIDSITGATETVHELGYWLPIGAITDVAVVILAASAVSFAVRVVRIVASFLSGGGGSAA